MIYEPVQLPLYPLTFWELITLVHVILQEWRLSLCWGKLECYVFLWLWNFQVSYSFCFSKNFQVNRDTGMGRINEESMKKKRRQEEKKSV